MTKLESYEDLEARMEHMESLIQRHFDEDPNRAMTSAAASAKKRTRRTRTPSVKEE